MRTKNVSVSDGETNIGFFRGKALGNTFHKEKKNRMKRILVFGVLLISATCAFAQAVSLGALASFSPVVFDDQTVLVSGTSMSLDYSFSNIGVRVFADFTYGEVSLGFAAPVTQLTMKVSAIPTTVPFSLSLFDVRLVGKYPFHFGSFTVFPLAGGFC
jgi:hypothetical protein